MASNLYRGFTIDHDPTQRKSINCKDCVHYDECDGSCSKTAFVPKNEGFDLWRNCKSFKLSKTAYNYDIKARKYKAIINHRVSRAIIVTKSSKKAQPEYRYDWTAKPYSCVPVGYGSAINKPKAVIKAK